MNPFHSLIHLARIGLDILRPGINNYSFLKKCTLIKGNLSQPRQHIKNQRHYFANKGPSSQGMVFPVVMYGCGSWTIKKTECRRIDAFELWCWRRLLRVPWAVRRSNQSILKEISPEYSLEGLMLKLKLPQFKKSFDQVLGQPLEIIYLASFTDILCLQDCFRQVVENLWSPA